MERRFPIPRDHPNPMTPQPVIAVFGSSRTGGDEVLYEEALQCGRLLAEAGYAVVTGGYGGVMEAVSKGAASAGGRVIGITAPEMFPNRTGANRWVAEERSATGLTDRIHHLLESSRAAIVLDGGIGTFTELVVSWCLSSTDALRGRPPRPLVAVGSRWSTLVADLAEALEADASLVTCVVDSAAAVAEIARQLPPTPWEEQDSRPR
jgi:uncharacterized protein (TIGR00730 family)